MSVVETYSSTEAPVVNRPVVVGREKCNCAASSYVIAERYGIEIGTVMWPAVLYVPVSC